MAAGYGHGVGCGGGGDAVVEGVAVGVDGFEVVVGVGVLRHQAARKQGEKHCHQCERDAGDAGSGYVIFHNSGILRFRIIRFGENTFFLIRCGFEQGL